MIVLLLVGDVRIDFCYLSLGFDICDWFVIFVIGLRNLWYSFLVSDIFIGLWYFLLDCDIFYWIVIFFIGLWYFLLDCDMTKCAHIDTPCPPNDPPRLFKSTRISYMFTIYVVHTLSRARKGENFPDITLPMKEKVRNYVWQNMYLQNKTYFTYDLSVFQIIRMPCKSSGHF